MFALVTSGPLNPSFAEWGALDLLRKNIRRKTYLPSTLPYMTIFVHHCYVWSKIFHAPRCTPSRFNVDKNRVDTRYSRTLLNRVYVAEQFLGNLLNTEWWTDSHSVISIHPSLTINVTKYVRHTVRGIFLFAKLFFQKCFERFFR